MTSLNRPRKSSDPALIGIIAGLLLHSHQGISADAVGAKIDSQRNVVREMLAELTAIKPIRKPQRELMTRPRFEIALI